MMTSRSSRLVAALSALALVQGAFDLHAATFTWNNNSGYWTDPNNWSPGSAVPGAGDTAVFAGDPWSERWIYLPAGSAITLANLVFARASLSPLVTVDELRQDRRAVLTVTESFVWTGGALGYGSPGGDPIGVIVSIPSGAQMNIGPGNTVQMDWSVITNAGTVNWTNNTIQFAGGSLIYCAPGSQWNLWSDGVVAHHGANAAPRLEFAPGSTVTKRAGNGHTSLAESSDMQLSLGGTVNIEVGTLGFSQWGNTIVVPMLEDGLVINGPGGFKGDFGQNVGDLIVNGPVTVNNARFELNTGRIVGTNAVSAVLAAAGGAEFHATNCAGIVGTVRIAAGTVFNLSGRQFDNLVADGLGSGGMQVAGTLNWLGGGETFRFINGATLDILPGGKFYPGSGKAFDSPTGGPLRNAGLWSPATNAPGTFLMYGNYQQASTGVLQLDIAGRNAGEFDVVDVSQKPWSGYGGTATLDGTLRVNLRNGFAPAAGDSFQVLNYGTRVGQFSTLELPALGGNLFWLAQYGASALTLSVVAPPTLSITKQGSNAVLSWPAGYPTAILESSPTLGAGASWTTVSSSGNSALVPLGSGNQFFRLKLQ